MLNQSYSVFFIKMERKCKTFFDIRRGPANAKLFTVCGHVTVLN
jgi:hypothetical protein